MSKLSHKERTATDRREPDLHKVIIHKVEQVNEEVRLIELRIAAPKEPIKFLPGQWLDVHIPTLHKAGGFTITSTPKEAKENRGYIELAIQLSPKNPPAAWLWQKKEKIEGRELQVRVGGSFVWPPPGIDIATVKRIVFIAGGVGINPLMSILTHLYNHPSFLPPNIQFLYSTRRLSATHHSVLFRSRLRALFASKSSPTRTLTLFHTPRAPIDNPSQFRTWKEQQEDIADQRRDKARIATAEKSVLERYGRMSTADLMKALGPTEERREALCYVCGPPALTDWAADVLRSADGMQKERVLCEKWW